MQFAGLPPAFLPRQRVQDIDRVADVQAFPEPTWRDGVRVQDEPLRIVQRRTFTGSGTLGGLCVIASLWLSSL